ncbi:MAG: hypothetical protein ACYC6L_15525 [Anaerolineae bacterium]
MQIHLVDTAHVADVRRFIQFPFDLYRGDPLWVPPLWRDMRLALNRREHPYYSHSQADYFLVEQDGSIFGRLGVLNNSYYNRYQNRKTAFLTFFEVVDDSEAANALLDAASAWAHARKLNELAGTRGLLSSDPTGILVEGFEHRPAIGMPYNPPYYARMMEAYGFEKFTDSLSGYLPGDHTLEQRLYDIAARVRERRGFWVKAFKTKAEMNKWVPKAVQTVNEAFSSFGADYFPVPPEEIDISAKTIVEVADPRLVKLVMHGDEIAGFIFSYHDISAALQRCKGHLLPFGWWQILREPSRTEWVNINGLGLLPKYQGLGANAVLYTELADTLHPFGFKHAEVVAVTETNFKSRSDMETMGVRWYKRHRYYNKWL